MDMLLTWAYWAALAEGVPVTLALTGIGVLAGTVAAVPVALLRLASVAPLRWLGTAYVFFFRGVPLLLLLFFIYHGLPRLRELRDTWLWDWVLQEAFTCAAAALILSNAAYIGEVLRAGIRAVPRGEVEAARAIGHDETAVFLRFVLPSAFRASIFAYGNELVFTLKASALASTITVYDVLGQADKIQTRTSEPFIPLLGAALVYLVLVQLVQALIRAADRRLNRHRAGPRLAAMPH